MNILFFSIIAEDGMLELRWSRNEIIIQVGDTVVWEWEQSLQLNLYLTAPQRFNFTRIIDTYFGRSNSENLSIYTQTFTEVGDVFYYISEDMSDTQAPHGKIIVSKLHSSLKRIDVYVGEYQTAYNSEFCNNTTSIYGNLSQTSSDTNRYLRDISNLASDLIDKNSCMDLSNFLVDQIPPQVLYSACVTPLVYSVEPKEGYVSETTFSIIGIRFSTDVKENNVWFGSHQCAVQSSTFNKIECKISVNDDPPVAWRQLPLLLQMTENNTGNAFIADTGKTQIQFLPEISNVSPSTGPLQGGTDMIISGSTFHFDTNGMDVGLSLGFPCQISSVKHDEIKCTTLPSEVNNGTECIYSIIICIINRDEKYLCRDTGYNFTFSEDHTATVSSVSLADLGGSGINTIILQGSGFSDTMGWNLVSIKDFPCNITDFNMTTIICTVQPLPASLYQLSIKICNTSSNRCLGYVQIPEEYQQIRIQGFLSSMSPTGGSTQGGTEVTLLGSGFLEGSEFFDNKVLIGNSVCLVKSASLTSIICTTGHHKDIVVGGTNPIPIQVIVDQVEFVNSTVTFAYLDDLTPRVTALNPREGQLGDIINITGTLLGKGPGGNKVTVKIGGSECIVDAVFSNDNAIICSLTVNFAGSYNISVHIPPYGLAYVDTDLIFTYNLMLYNLSSTEGSFAGGNPIIIHGVGFDPSNVIISICNQTCKLTSTPSTLTQVECTVPQKLTSLNEDMVCSVELNSCGFSSNLANGYTYSVDLTPSVQGINRTRGGTQGGSYLQINGAGFTSPANVTIAGSTCVVINQNETIIDCITEASSRTIRAKIKVFISMKGFALSDTEFWYVDLWSSQFSWQNNPPPIEGDFVVIPKGQTLLLDTITPVLSYLLIKGELIFDRDADDNEVGLHSQGILITSQGRLEIGTETEPFLPKTEVVLYGHILSTEIPIYGAKSLGLREGEIDMHGRPLNITWTLLAKTAQAGERELHLRDSVAWEIEGKIVIASTSFSQQENEYMEIESINEGVSGSVLILKEPLKYKHIAVQQCIDGRLVETSAEVGYLTRNIVVRGNRNEEWSDIIPACEEEFRPGQFQVQTCFRGRFGNEIASDQFGGQIFIHAVRKSQNMVTGRFSYIELSHVGQAFKLGRYPIHFHLSGNVSGSYVRGCAIYHSFNRAVTIHSVDYLMVENNVVYDVLGHAYFMEDGNEQNNTLQDNLAVFIKSSSSLLNVDITPAGFWIVNANNIVRRNAAAGGTHFGFWYRLPEHPTGPSFTRSICPQKQQILEFVGNTAHSFGRYGLWIFRHYFPSPSGECGDNRHAPAYFDGFLSWRNEKGVEYAESGSVQIRDSILMDNKLAGVEATDLTSVWERENGSLVAGTLIVGHSEISLDNFCTFSGIKTPASYFLTVSNVTFANFDRVGCYSIQACSECHDQQGGFETRYEKISFINTTKLTLWQWEQEHIHRDLDGTLTGIGEPSLLLPTNDLLDSSQCRLHAESSDGNVMGSICNGSIKFGRVAIFNPTPRSLQFTAINITNEYGTVILPYVSERIKGGPGYMVLLQLNSSSGFHMTWLEGQTFTNISYTLFTCGVGVNDFLVLLQDFPQALDLVVIQGVMLEQNITLLDDPATASNGDYVIYNNDTTVSYVVKGSRLLPFKTAMCFYKDCVPPPPPTIPPPVPLERPVNGTMLWSELSTWPDNRLPEDGENVTINGSVYILLDVPTIMVDQLEIVDGATLELLDGMDHTILANHIIIQGARLVAGYPDVPFFSGVRFILNGNNTSPELRNVGLFSPPVGVKAIAVFGELILNAPHRTGRTWTILSQTAEIGSTSILLVHRVDWSEGNHIVITSTSFNAYQSEVFEIQSISPDGQNLTVNASLQYTHIGRADSQGHFGAEVGLLSRTIVIENGNLEVTNEESFGCRVLVSRSSQFEGVALLRGVEFKGCGQLGYTDSFDPRFALAFLHLDNPFTPSYVTECSFHDGFNTAIGIFDSSNIQVKHNVIHGTVGASMIVTGQRHHIAHNLASLSQFIGTYRGRNEPSNSLWTANFNLENAKTNELIFEFNHAAGGARAGFHMHGEDCTVSSSLIVRNNMAHSSLHGIHLGYSDGRPSGCSKFINFIIYSCYNYGLFSYNQAGIEIFNSTFINNNAAIYVSVVQPTALSHKVGNKSVIIKNTSIISTLTSTGRCESEMSAMPPIATHPKSFFGISSLSGGHVGIVIPSFLSGFGHFPDFPWHTVTSYPAINGITFIENVTFVNFGSHCEGRKRDVVLITNPNSEDANHPVHLKSIKCIGETTSSGTIDARYKVYIHTPNINRINPSDCVDMDCDGMKNVLIKDIDGSFTGEQSLRTIIPMAEIGWDAADRRRGIGDFRIPRSILTNPNGSVVDADEVFPTKGIIRGTSFGNEEDCSLVVEWNAYLCTKLDHLMLVMENLDEDTQVRRLSPIALGANGFVNLINGPMDNGWCGGYTCQERISTFFSLVAAGFNYTIDLTSSNPQNFYFHLLHANDEQSIVVSIFYNNPQRLDVLVDNDGVDMYITPNNAYFEEESLRYRDVVLLQYLPKLDNKHGTNIYDRNTKRLYITIKGKRTIKIITTPVIMTSLTLSVTIKEFFDEVSLVNNLAFILGIPENKIRVVSVVRESVTRRKRQASDGEIVMVGIEIGDSPLQNDNTSSNSSLTNTSSLTFNELESLSDTLVNVLQTNQMNLDLRSVTVTRPVARAVDPTGGVLATPETGGPQPEEIPENSNIETFYERQLMSEAIMDLNPFSDTFGIPSRLVIKQFASSGPIEGLSLLGESVPQVYMENSDGSLSTTLGLNDPWTLSAKINTGPDNAFLTNSTADFNEGIASFDELIFSHPGTYSLFFSVIYPTIANFSLITSDTISVAARQLGIVIIQQPQDGNTTSPLYPYPTIILVDISNASSLVKEHSWRNTTWFVDATVLLSVGQTYSMPLINGVGRFTDIQLSAGSNELEFKAYQISGDEEDTIGPIAIVSDTFTIVKLPVFGFILTYNNDYQTTVQGREEAFLAIFKETLSISYPMIEILNATVHEGSVVVIYYVTSRSCKSLFEVIDVIAEGDYMPFSFTFRDTPFQLSSVEMDSNLNPNLSCKLGGYFVALGLSLGLSALLFLPVVIPVGYFLKKKFSGSGTIKVSALIHINTPSSWHMLALIFFYN